MKTAVLILATLDIITFSFAHHDSLPILPFVLACFDVLYYRLDPSGRLAGYPLERIGPPDAIPCVFLVHGRIPTTKACVANYL